MNGYFEGRRFSILGDSISTLAGCNPDGYRVFYQGDISRQAKVTRMEDTWWGMVIGHFHGTLLINNSWSGSLVSGEYPSGCSPRRTGGLHVGSTLPDVILVYMGTNDWIQGVPPGCEGEQTGGECFEDAYAQMLRRIRDNYPGAQVWCCTLAEAWVSSKPQLLFPYAPGGIHIDAYNQVIRAVAQAQGCGVIDFYQCHIPYDSLDITHPVADGMRTLADMAIREMTGKKGRAAD